MKYKYKKINPLAVALTYIIIAAIAFGVGFYLSEHFNRAPAIEDIQDGKNDWKLPTETEKTTVTKDEVESKLFEISEISSYSGKYTINKSVDQSRYLLDNFAIPGTKNSISITCTGIVKVGYDISKITIDIDNIDNTDPKIHIGLPDPTVLDNYVIWDTVECVENNTPLHPIEFSQYKELITDIEAEGLAEVESEEIYEKAEEHIKEIIELALSGFSDYQIVFM